MHVQKQQKCIHMNRVKIIHQFQITRNKRQSNKFKGQIYKIPTYYNYINCRKFLSTPWEPFEEYCRQHFQRCCNNIWNWHNQQWTIGIYNCNTILTSFDLNDTLRFYFYLSISKLACKPQFNNWSIKNMVSISCLMALILRMIN